MHQWMNACVNSSCIVHEGLGWLLRRNVWGFSSEEDPKAFRMVKYLRCPLGWRVSAANAMGLRGWRCNKGNRHATGDIWVSLRTCQTVFPPRFYEATWASDAGFGFRSVINKRGNSSFVWRKTIAVQIVTPTNSAGVWGPQVSLVARGSWPMTPWTVASWCLINVSCSGRTGCGCGRSSGTPFGSRRPPTAAPMEARRRPPSKSLGRWTQRTQVGDGLEHVGTIQLDISGFEKREIPPQISEISNF